MPHLPKYVRDPYGREYKLRLVIDKYGRPHYRYFRINFTAAEKIGITFVAIAKGFGF